MLKNVALVLSGLVGGLVTGVLGAALLVPRVLAEGPHPAAPAPQRWQQFCEPVASIAEASSTAGARGVEGWELVGFFGGALCFKRPGPTASTAAARPEGAPSWPGY
jgi:hypothetical protein